MVGLKRPVTVALGGSDEKGQVYELLCGQGRFEALVALGEKKIPCCVIAVDKAERYLISLTENIARRKHSIDDLLKGIRVLEERGYSPAQISLKTNLDAGYVSAILHLLKNGEQRLIAAVEKKILPIELALKICRGSNADTQDAMVEAYETKLLRGDQLMYVRRLIDKRQALGKRYESSGRSSEKPTPKKLLQTYQTEVRRQKLMIQKANIQEQRLLLIASVFKRLLADEHFRTLLRAESIDDIPKPLADRIPQERLP